MLLGSIIYKYCTPPSSTRHSFSLITELSIPPVSDMNTLAIILGLLATRISASDDAAGSRDHKQCSAGVFCYSYCFWRTQCDVAPQQPNTIMFTITAADFNDCMRYDDTSAASGALCVQYFPANGTCLGYAYCSNNPVPMKGSMVAKIGDCGSERCVSSGYHHHSKIN